MKFPPRNLIAGVVALILFLAIPHVAFAKSPAGGKKPAPVAPHHTTIQTISATSITIKQSSGSKTLAITQDTVITFKRQTVKFDALKPGMRVSFVAGSDPTVAARIDADDPPTEAKK
jgi:hypothetical protein